MGGRAQIDDNSSLQFRVDGAWSNPAKAGTNDDILTAKAFNTVTAGVPFNATVSAVPGMTGRNLRVIVVDANNSETWALRITGKDQFGEKVSERFPASGSQVGAATVVGKRIFAAIDPNGIVFETAAGDLAAGDNVKVAIGDLVGLPFMMSSDIHEILDAHLQPANQATAPTKVAANATNFNSTYMYADFTQFGGGNVVTAGDSIVCRYRSSTSTPDYLSNIHSADT